jgi:SAM-dependent methyltransferase
VRSDYARQYRLLWERHWWWRSREAWLLAWIGWLHRRAPVRRILDIGCGDGLFFERLSRFGDVEGIEPAAELVTDVRWRGRIRTSRLEAGCTSNGRYDLALMLDVLEHIEDEHAALDAASSEIAPGGRLVLTVPALPWLWSWHDEANEHHRRYTPHSLREVLEAAGFAVEVVRFFFLWTVVPLLARRALWPGGIGAGDYAVTIPPAPINRALEWLSRCEHAVGRICPWPLGSSLLAIGRRVV